MRLLRIIYCGIVHYGKHWHSFTETEKVIQGCHKCTVTWESSVDPANFYI